MEPTTAILEPTDVDVPDPQRKECLLNIIIWQIKMRPVARSRFKLKLCARPKIGKTQTSKDTEKNYDIEYVHTKVDKLTKNGKIVEKQLIRKTNVSNNAWSWNLGGRRERVSSMRSQVNNAPAFLLSSSILPRYARAWYTMEDAIIL